jgi:hypothetical protein
VRRWNSEIAPQSKNIKGSFVQKKKPKTFYYRRAVWDNQGRDTLEVILKKAHDKMPTTADRSFDNGSEGKIEGAHYHADSQGIFLQIAAYVPGEPTSTIGKNKRGKSAVIGAEGTPEGKDYLSGEVFVLVKDNHVILCTSGAREPTATAYFYNVLVRAKEKAAGSLALEKIAQLSKLAMIRKEGVKEIQLGASLYEASRIEINKDTSKIDNLRAKIANQIMQIFAEDATLQEIKESENLNINLSIKFDGAEGRKVHKDPKFGDAGLRRLLKTSEEFVKDLGRNGRDEGFAIITRNNNRITDDEIRVSSVYNIEVLGKSISHSDAWEKLAVYYNDLKQNGVLAQ